MWPGSALEIEGSGQLAENVLHFARVLRKAGLRVGTDRALLTLQALQIAGLGSRAELHDVLQSCLLERVQDRRIFEQAFRVFWSDPDLLGRVMRLLLPAGTPAADPGANAPRRLSEALSPDSAARHVPATERPVLQVEESWSDRERLWRMDFESMSAAEFSAAQRVVAALEPLVSRLRTRRQSPAEHGTRLDLRRLLRDCGRYGGDALVLPRRVRRTRIQPLCVILDISGSMSRYSRMFLHFMHAVMNGGRTLDLRVSAFVFGTRLSDVTGLLRDRDVDAALARISRRVEDWSGGTRIGACLKQFNQGWGRRLQLGKSTVLLVTDGLEHAQIELLEAQALRLSRSCARLLWLNPLLRYAAFEPKARGVRALLAHVDRPLPVHNLDSLAQLVRTLESSARDLAPWS